MSTRKTRRMPSGTFAGTSICKAPMGLSNTFVGFEEEFVCDLARGTGYLQIQAVNEPKSMIT